MLRRAVLSPAVASPRGGGVPSTAARRCLTITVTAPVGGTGTSRVAANLAAHAARQLDRGERER